LAATRHIDLLQCVRLAEVRIQLFYLNTYTHICYPFIIPGSNNAYSTDGPNDQDNKDQRSRPRPGDASHQTVTAHMYKSAKTERP